VPLLSIAAATFAIVYTASAVLVAVALALARITKPVDTDKVVAKPAINF